MALVLLPYQQDTGCPSSLPCIWLLIECEWIQAGHPFASRCAKSAYAGSKHKHTGPVFLLFLDCVGQVSFLIMGYQSNSSPIPTAHDKARYIYPNKPRKLALNNA